MAYTQKVLVTGATGLVGSHLLYSLVSKGQDVRAVYRSKANIRECASVFRFYGPDSHKLLDRVEWVPADITDYFSLIDALDGVSRVYHCAAMVSFDPSDKTEMFRVNEEGTSNLVNACLEKSIDKLCYVSSIGALGTAVNGDFVDEETAWQNNDNHSAYSLSKFKSEMEVWRGTKEGLNAVIVNPGVILGPGDTNRSSGALFGKVQKGMRFYTKGATGFVDVRDVVDAMIRLMDSDTVNERYVLVSENLSYLDLLTQAALALHVKPPTVEATRFMAGLAWRTDWLLRFFTGKKPAFTRENAKTSLNQSYYSSQKVIKQFGLSFIPIHQSIVETAQWIRTSQR